MARVPQWHLPWDGYGKFAIVTLLQCRVEFALEFRMPMAVLRFVRWAHGDIGEGVMVNKFRWMTRDSHSMDVYRNGQQQDTL